MRLSKLQERILCAIYDLRTNNPDDHPDPILRRRVFAAVQDYWPADTGANTRNVSFSRSVRSLIENGLVAGFALAWVVHEVDQGVMNEDIMFWQGGGRRKTSHGDHYTVKADQPVYRMFDLTHTGHEVAENLD